jgi:hypothetical protein
METYLRHKDEKMLLKERDELRAMLEDRRPGVRIEDRGAMQKREQDLGRIVDAKVAPDLTPEQRDAVAKEEKELREKWREGMPSFAEMRRKPSGAVGKHMRWEKANKNRILRWKNCVLMLNKGNDDPDIANIEMHRPRTSTLNMEDAAIPGRNYDIPSEQFKANYEATFGKKEGENHELEALREEVADLRKLVQLEAQQKANKARTDSSNGEGKPFDSEPCVCGKVTHGRSPGMAANGMRAHQRHCAEFKAANQTVAA